MRIQEKKNLNNEGFDQPGNFENESTLQNNSCN